MVRNGGVTTLRIRVIRVAAVFALMVWSGTRFALRLLDRTQRGGNPGGGERR